MINNITEDYVSFEVAKLLKEKGFDVNHINLVKKSTGNYFAPTHALAIKWIRENFDDFQKQGLSKITKVKESSGDDNLIGICPKCDSDIFDSDCYSGNFVCSECNYHGQVYELIKFGIVNILKLHIFI